MEPRDLPHIDEHSVDVAAEPDRVWLAMIRSLRKSFSGAGVGWAARLLGCDSTGESDWSRPAPGREVPGFRLEKVQPPRLITLTGRHRFSEYALIFRIDEKNGAARCRAESRARFPGWRGRLYRTAVVGSRGHRILLRRLLHDIKRVAEQPP